MLKQLNFYTKSDKLNTSCILFYYDFGQLCKRQIDTMDSCQVTVGIAVFCLSYVLMAEVER